MRGLCWVRVLLWVWVWSGGCGCVSVCGRGREGGSRTSAGGKGVLSQPKKPRRLRQPPNPICECADTTRVGEIARSGYDQGWYLLPSVSSRDSHVTVILSGEKCPRACPGTLTPSVAIDVVLLTQLRAVSSYTLQQSLSTTLGRAHSHSFTQQFGTRVSAAF